MSSASRKIHEESGRHETVVQVGLIRCDGLVSLSNWKVRVGNKRERVKQH